jgi:hypothetical protein
MPNPAPPASAAAAAHEPVAPVAASFSFPELTAMTPAFGRDMSSTLAHEWLRSLRTLGAVQARLLDHGVRELQALLGEAGEIARSQQPSDIVVIQARAVRRSADALHDTLNDVAATARARMAGR